MYHITKLKTRARSHIDGLIKVDQVEFNILLFLYLFFVYVQRIYLDSTTINIVNKTIWIWHYLPSSFLICC